MYLVVGRLVSLVSTLLHCRLCHTLLIDLCRLCRTLIIDLCWLWCTCFVDLCRSCTHLLHLWLSPLFRTFQVNLSLMIVLLHKVPLVSFGAGNEIGAKQCTIPWAGKTCKQRGLKFQHGSLLGSLWFAYFYCSWIEPMYFFLEKFFQHVSQDFGMSICITFSML